MMLWLGPFVEIKAPWMPYLRTWPWSWSRFEAPLPVYVLVIPMGDGSVVKYSDGSNCSFCNGAAGPGGKDKGEELASPASWVVYSSLLYRKPLRGDPFPPEYWDVPGVWLGIFIIFQPNVCSSFLPLRANIGSWYYLLIALFIFMTIFCPWIVGSPCYYCNIILPKCGSSILFGVAVYVDSIFCVYWSLWPFYVPVLANNFYWSNLEMEAFDTYYVLIASWDVRLDGECSLDWLRPLRPTIVLLNLHFWTTTRPVVISDGVVWALVNLPGILLVWMLRLPYFIGGYVLLNRAE